MKKPPAYPESVKDGDNTATSLSRGGEEWVNKRRTKGSLVLTQYILK
jgi:hypothetical protein